LEESKERDFRLVCGVFVKQRTPGEVTCNTNITTDGFCDSTTVASQTWPPRIFKYDAKFRLRILYYFFNCLNFESQSETPANSATTKTSEFIQIAEMWKVF